MLKVDITKYDCNQRVDKYLRKYLNNASLSYIYKLFRKKDIKINGKWVLQSYILKENDILTAYIKEEDLLLFSNEKDVIKKELPYEIIYEDENVLFVNKPRGVLVHGSEDEKRKTLSNDVLNYLYFKEEYNPKDKGFTPSPAHRLDRNTSGIVMFGKNLESLQVLEKLLKDKTSIVKEYCALSFGVLKENKKIQLPLLKNERNGTVTVGSLKDGAKEAITLIEPIFYNEKYSLIKAILITGRTHQIRVHLSESGYPIVGDAKYGNFSENKEIKKKYNFDHQFLHAKNISFLKIDGKLNYLSNKTFIAKFTKEEQQLLTNLSIIIK